MSGLIKKIWQRTLDHCSLWGQPAVSAIALISGSLLTYDFERLRESHEDWAGPISAVEGAILPIFVFSALLSLIISILLRGRSKTIRSLTNKLQMRDAEVGEIGNVIVFLCDGLLLNLANKLNLSQGAQVRLSLYLHDEPRSAFIPCGRYSRNPAYNRPGRTHYPDSQGCIERGWRHGWHFDNQVPPASQASARRTYNLRNYNVPEHVTDQIEMKSTLYAIKRLDNHDGRAIAVLVVESTDKDLFTEDELRDTLEGSASDYARVIHALRSYVPNPVTAADKGL